ncbi:tyrosine-type recombinase/integrase [Corallococcus sp. RDP092CA]|uniref:tyrosine-type recombinase/integrase n=1 Tax=Corallococcus sp. RDP092CA TaxID=3109369 RepID=UPI0035B2E8D2
MEPIGWHDLRHSYGSHLAIRGAPLKVVQEWICPSTIEMTMRYAALSPDTWRAARSVSLTSPLRQRATSVQHRPRLPPTTCNN